MRLSRIGAFHPTRISFARTLIRRMARESWRFSRPVFALDDAGIGTAVYRIDTGTTPIWFVVFADHLAPEDRTDRVIAEKWDATFTLTTEEPDAAALTRLRANISLQEAGRCSSRELVLSPGQQKRAVVRACGRGTGQRPPTGACQVLEVGYLVRTPRRFTATASSDWPIWRSFGPTGCSACHSRPRCSSFSRPDSSASIGLNILPGGAIPTGSRRWRPGSAARARCR